MTTWTVNQENLDDFFLIEEVPVLVHRLGTCPELVNDRGESIRDIPFLSITHGGTTKTHKDGSRRVTYNYIQVRGHYPADATSYHRPRALTLWETRFPMTEELGPYLEQAKAEGVDMEAFRAIPERYRVARERIDQARRHSVSRAREEYERACAELGAWL